MIDLTYLIAFSAHLILNRQSFLPHWLGIRRTSAQ